ncbi:hypothetical protein ABWL39_20815, partial [Chitinivorax sp. PXF-14]|uniref:hypothetical protein n=1 Tax=Chitinivorax sp. PXF-14 TaxID=3230488 RepID=UPI003467C719
MDLDAHPYSEAQEVHWGSDIQKIEWLEGQLSVLVARELLPNHRVSGLRIHFDSVSGVRLLDELDLARYWNAKNFPFGHHVLKVKSGGWSSEENCLQGFPIDRSEWLIVTGNGCLSVFSQSDPHIDSVEFDAS